MREKMSNNSRMARFGRSAVALTALVALFAVGGCSWNNDEPASTTTAVVSEPQASETIVPVAPVDDGTCSDDVIDQQFVMVDGKVECLTAEKQRAYAETMRKQAQAGLHPIAASVNAGASHEAALRELVAISCKKPVDNPYYWDVASGLYVWIIGDANPDALASKWPADFSVALKRGCY